MSKSQKPKTVELVRSGYQPTKAEMEEIVALGKADGSPPSVEEIAKAVCQSPGKVRWIDRPRGRRS